MLLLAYVMLTGGVLIRNIIVPLLKILRIGKVMSYEEAASIVGQHFSQVQDKLLNALQLYQMQKYHPDNELLLASIEQKTGELKVISFADAVNLKENIKHIKYPLLSFLLFLLLWWISPSMVKDGTFRLVHYDKAFTPPLPFEWTIENARLEVKRNENFTLEIKLSGKEVPSKMYVETEGYRYKMDKHDYMHFEYTWKNVQQDIPFALVSDQHILGKFLLKVLPNPGISEFNVRLEYPKYLKKENENKSNITELIIPEGTKMVFSVKTRDATHLTLMEENEQKYYLTSDNNFFNHTAIAHKSGVYKFFPSLGEVYADTFFFSCQVIPDACPSVDAEQRSDSLNESRKYFRCLAKDDYGITKILFHLRVKQNDKVLFQTTETLPHNGVNTYQEVYYLFDFETLEIPAGSWAEYYFEAWDNDGVNGSKAGRSELFVYKVPDKQELARNIEKTEKDIQEGMEKNIRKMHLFQHKIQSIQQKITQQNQIGWQEKTDIRELLNLHHEIINSLRELQRIQMQKNNLEEKYTQSDPELLEKQKMLENLLKELMTPELQKLLQELEKLMDEQDKKQVYEKLNEIEKEHEILEKQIDRSLELFKQLKLEKDLQKAIDKLDELQQRQEALAEETLRNRDSEEKIKEEQESLNKEFEQLQQMMDDIRKLNEEMEQPQPLPNTQQQEKDIQMQMQQGLDQLQQGQNKKASQLQKKASQKMEEMKQNLQFAMDAMQQEQSSEDIDNLKNILDNLIQLSFEQEQRMVNQQNMRPMDPAYVKEMQAQQKIREKFKILEDSLLRLAKRNPQIESMVFKETASVNENTSKAIEKMEDRKKGEAAVFQQYAVTSMNNLALMLSESLQQMQEKQKNSKSGTGSCKNPNGQGKGQSSIKSMRQMQEALSKQLEEMRKALEKGKNPQNGEDAVLPSQSLSQKLAQMAAQQAQLREQLQKLAQEMKNKSQSKGLQQVAEMMEQIEKDIVNKNITRETLKRQQDILTRLLEAENAEREREFDETRESREPKEWPVKSPAEMFRYSEQEKKSNAREEIQNLPPELKPYYKNIVNQYLRNINQ